MEVAVLGAGYAGVAATRQLERVLPPAVDVSVIDDTRVHELQHEIHRVIRYPDLASDLRIPVAELVERADAVEAIVTDIDETKGRFETLGGERFDPSYVIVCLGAVTADYGIPGVRSHGQTCKTVEDALSIRTQVRACTDGDRIVVAGAGLTGVQVAGELAALSASLDLDLPVTLIEQRETVAPSFSSGFGEEIRRALDRAGVAVRTGTTITAVEEGTLHRAEGSPIEYTELVWTGGIQGPEAMSGHRWGVDADLRVDGSTFVAGDAAQVIDDRGALVPAAAQTAVRQGRLAADNVSRLVRGGDEDLVFEPRLSRYRYRPRAWFVTVGDETVGMVDDRIITGRTAETAKTAVGAGYLTAIGAVDAALGRVSETIRGTAHDA